MTTVTIAKFTNRPAYDAFEASEKTRLGLPKTGTNQKTKQPAPRKQQTIAATSPLTNRNAGDNTVACFLEAATPTTGRDIITEDQAKTQGFLLNLTVTKRADGTGFDVKGFNNNNLGGGGSPITP